MLSTNTLQGEDLEELEGHMRDAVDDLIGRGLSPEESFLIANRRLGSAPSIGQEYAKVKNWPMWRFRIIWMLLGIIGYLLMSDALIGLGRGLTLLTEYGLGSISTLAVVLSRLIGLGFVVLAVWLVKRLLAQHRDRYRRIAAKLLKHPVLTAAMGIILLCLTRVMNSLWILWLARISTPYEMGRIMLTGRVAESIMTTLFYLMLPIVLIALVRRHWKMTAS